MRPVLKNVIILSHLAINVDVQPTDIVRNLGVLLDSELTMK